jgi:hypothetical protein
VLFLSKKHVFIAFRGVVCVLRGLYLKKKTQPYLTISESQTRYNMCTGYSLLFLSNLFHVSQPHLTISESQTRT